MLNYDVLTLVAHYSDDESFVNIRGLNRDMSNILYLEMLARRFAKTRNMYNLFQKDFYENAADFTQSSGMNTKLKKFYKILNVCFYKHKAICKESKVGHMFFDTLDDKLDEFFEDGMSRKRYMKYKKLIAQRRKM